MKAIFRSSVFAGIAISLGGTVYLQVGGLAGAVLFSFGLLTVVHYALKLYTGTAGFIGKKDFPMLAVVLAGNLVGCFLTAMAVRYASPDCVAVADGILNKRLACGPLKCGVLGIGCGLIMTTAVNFARKQQMLPLLFGVPLFILCGFTHCIADAFYYCMASGNLIGTHLPMVLAVYASIVIGNFLGCNLYRLFV